MAENSSTNTPQQYNKSFEDALKKLNPEQLNAVSQIEGPVLVVAGPGTGKTHILTARIGRILQETDTNPNNILCLTFTDAGVHAMRERLLEFIGPEAHRVHIYTFHSFCNSIIQENLELFGRHDLEPLNDLERVEIIRKLIDELPFDHPVKNRRNDPYFYEKHLYDLFKRMKSEDWKVKFVHQKIDAYLKDLPNREDFIYKVNTKKNKKGDLKESKIDDANRKMERLRAAANLYPRYIKLMENARRYDYDDMILWVLRGFENNEALLRNYQERYLYFLVDEYQDTNGSQNNIIQKLIEYWDNPNVFIVGDDDQSIFEFQGARLQNLVDFHHFYKKDLELVLLKENYRSSQHILDTSKTLIDNNQNRITSRIEGIEKTLDAKNKLFAESSILPKIIEYPNRTHEEIAIVTQLEELQLNNIPLNEVAIIYAKHKQIRNIISLLEKKGIPYNTKRQVNILDLPLIQNLRTLLTYINDEHHEPYSSEHELYKIMHFEFLNIPIKSLSKLSFFMAKLSYDQKIPWRDIIGDEDKLRQVGIEQPIPFIEFSKLLDQQIGDYSNFTLLQFLERIINRSGLLSFLLKQPDKTWQLQVINTFFEFVKKETDKKPRFTLQKLLSIFSNMDANRLPIGILKTITAKEGVNLVTAHSSKGLEFQYVFMIDCVKDNWEPKGSGNAFRFPLPDTLTLSGEEDAIEARRRLFYVAMTRAMEHLQISFSQTDIAAKQLNRALYVDEIIEGANLEIETATLTEEKLSEAQALQLMEIEKPIIPAHEKDTIDALLEGFTLSISSLNRFLRCPLSFYFETVLRLPSAQSEAASFGLAMHYALHKLFEKRKLSKSKMLPLKSELFTYFQAEMSRQRSHFSEKEFERRSQLGKLHLEKYYDLNHNNWPEKTQTEYIVKNVEFNGVPLTGTIDRIDFIDEHTAHVVDYKTGNIVTKKTSRPKESNPIGGLYWRQLVFYKILYELHQPIFKIHSAEISYLEADNKNEYIRKTLEFNIDDVETVKKLITDSYQKIMNHEFYEGCAEPNCQWCNFVKQNILIDSFADLEAEDLDD